ncbi:hypothetical protein SAMN05443270_3065 [Lacrimispora sphenoides]|uniref:hypothetical protein n=1 Tax=Lacrimispora sphenoides TaxID=29370 RepID=UPI0008D4748B|nr:hypothetical protein [Lacrimispora sphenoides]SEU09141.1 hypothetical protein SAMN05443270_3065 [Lacrimispora sphenoides]
MEKFTNKDLEIISNGLLCLIGNAAKAKELVLDSASLNSIDEYMRTLQVLNSKVCRFDRSEGYDKTEKNMLKHEHEPLCCLNCRFYDKNDQINAFGTCEPQDEDFHCTYECNLSQEEIKELEGLTGHSR